MSVLFTYRPKAYTMLLQPQNQSKYRKFLKIEYRVYEDIQYLFHWKHWPGKLDIELFFDENDQKSFIGDVELPYCFIEKEKYQVYTTVLEEDGTTKVQILDGEDKFVEYNNSPKPISKEERER